MVLNVFARSDSMDLDVKPILTIVCHNLAEIMVYAMIRLPASIANVHLVTPDFHAKQI